MIKTTITRMNHDHVTLEFIRFELKVCTNIFSKKLRKKEQKIV